MEKLTANDPQTHSADLVAENIERLKAMFPELVTENADGAAINLDVLKALVGDSIVTDAEEKYGLSWHGKRRARQLALTPSTGTLRPCPEESVDWETTQNLMIEGDNLEVLKLLQKSYAGRVKMIYIDPPYNTGKDFVYPDDFKDNISNYLQLTGQVDGDGRRISSNTEASGRFHTDWLRMMYPRLKVARNLLREDGIIFVSIDDTELSDLTAACNEIWGEENFIACVSRVTKKGGNAGNYFSPSVDYILCYARNLLSVPFFRTPMTKAVLDSFKEHDDKGPYKWRNWYDSSLSLERSPNTRYPIKAPNGQSILPPLGQRWRNVESTFLQKLSEDEIKIVEQDSKHIDGNGEPVRWAVYYKLRPKDPDADGMVEDNLFLDTVNSLGTATLTELGIPFDFSKPTQLLRKLIVMATYFDVKQDQDLLILDFFAGSGTTGHATMAQNAEDGGKRRYILVQLPEPLDPQNKEQKAAADFCDKLGKPRNIAEICKERLRRAGNKIRVENPLFAGDTGFRVFKLDSSNIRAWDPDRERLAETLEGSIEHLKIDRTEQDILFELLLKLGLDLTVPIEELEVRSKELEGEAHTVHSVGGGVLMVCLSKNIANSDVEPLALGIVAWHKELSPAGDTSVIFRDSAFADDVAKTNITAILQQHGLENVRSL